MRMQILPSTVSKEYYTTPPKQSKAISAVKTARTLYCTHGGRTEKSDSNKTGNGNKVSKNKHYPGRFFRNRANVSCARGTPRLTPSGAGMSRGRIGCEWECKGNKCVQIRCLRDQRDQNQKRAKNKVNRTRTRRRTGGDKWRIWLTEGCVSELNWKLAE
jgi:hypothetical protein